jgi:hypothetical protein
MKGIILERRSNRTLLNKFPEGQLVIVVDGIVVGSALSLLVTEDFAFKTRYKAITGNFSQLTTLKEKFYTELTFYQSSIPRTSIGSPFI